MTKKILIGSAILFAILLIVVIVKKDTFSKRNATKIAIEEASLKSITESVTANGKIYPYLSI